MNNSFEKNLELNELVLQGNTRGFINNIMLYVYVNIKNYYYKNMNININMMF